MKRKFSILIIFITILLSSCVTTSAPPVEEKKYTRLPQQVNIGIIEFNNKTKYGARRLSDSALEILTTELTRSGNFIVVERARMDKILEEMKFQLSGVTTGENAAEIGKILNCEYLLVGSVSNFGVTTEGKDFIIVQQKIQKVKAEVDLRIIEVETGAVIYSAYGKGEIEKKISSNFGMGGTGGYDETLAGECLRIAINKSVHDLIEYFSVQ
ncbi:MAG: hypothetical protein KAR21_10495 [Spirochaetales bacterium]|nr:hypothetical protein [Spirochaetales bacterium]